MTRDEILAMTPGRELDLMIAEKVMGWEERVDFDCIVEDTDVLIRYEPFSNDVREFHPSTDISAAWEVVEKVGSVKVLGPNLERDWYASVLGNRKFGVFAKSAPEAICKAALLAVMDE